MFALSCFLLLSAQFILLLCYFLQFLFLHWVFYHSYVYIIFQFLGSRKWFLLTFSTISLSKSCSTISNIYSSLPFYWLYFFSFVLYFIDFFSCLFIFEISHTCFFLLLARNVVNGKSLTVLPFYLPTCWNLVLC